MNLLHDLDEVLEKQVEIRLQGQRFVLKSLSLAQVAELSRKVGQLASGTLPGETADQYFAVFSMAVENLQLEHVQEMTVEQSNRLYRIILERLAGRYAQKMSSPSEGATGEGEKKKSLSA